MNIIIKNGYETDIDTGIITDTRLSEVTDVCHHCKKNNRHVKVTATQKWGYGLNQIMAFFKCPICDSTWYYDIVRHQNHERLVHEGVIDPKTGKFTSKFEDDCKQRARKMTQDLLGPSQSVKDEYTRESLDYLRKNFKTGR